MRWLMRRLVLICSSLSVAACTVLGPDYHPPEAPELAHWPPQLHGLNDTRGQAPGIELEFWWKVFQDPLLNRLMTIAERENQQLKIAGLRILQARAILGMARASQYPQSQQLLGDASYVYQHSRGGLLPDGSQSMSDYNLGFAAGWELDFWGRFQRAIEAADANFFASIEAQKHMQVLVKAQVAELYFGWRILSARIEIAKKNAQLQKRSYEIANEQFRSGNTSELDYQQARTQYLATLAAIPQLQLLQTQAQNALATLLGRAPGHLPELDTELAPIPLIQPRQVSLIPAQLLLRRPDVQAAAWNIAVQSAQIGIAEADLYPAISLLGTLGLSGSSASITPKLGYFMLGPNLRWNLFDWGAIKNNVRLQDARLQQLIEQYTDTVLQAALEIDNAAIGVVKTAEQVQLLKETVQSAERALEIANTSYREGFADFQRVLDAQRTLFTQNDRLLSIRGENITHLIALYKSLGGGWSANASFQQSLPQKSIEQMQQRTNWGDLLSTPIPQPPDLLQSPSTNTTMP